MGRFFGCEFKNGRCQNDWHERAKQREGSDECTKATAWRQSAEPCPGCDELIPEHCGERLNPALLAEYSLGNVVRPTLKAAVMTKFVAVMRPGVHVCITCATEIRQALAKSSGCIKLTNGELIRPFITAAEAIIVEVERKHQAAPVVAPSPSVEQLVERKRQADRSFILNFAGRIMAGDVRGIVNAKPITRDGQRLTPCVIRVNAAEHCQDSRDGYGDFRHMPAIVRPDGRGSYGFCWACAELIRAELGDKTFLCDLATAIPACQFGDPWQYVAEQRERQANPPKVVLHLVPRPRMSDPHRDGYASAMRAEREHRVRPPVVTPPPTLTIVADPEETAAERQRKHEEREANARRMATDLTAGAMRPRPAKEGKKKQADAQKRRGR